MHALILYKVPDIMQRTEIEKTLAIYLRSLHNRDHFNYLSEYSTFEMKRILTLVLLKRTHQILSFTALDTIKILPDVHIHYTKINHKHTPLIISPVSRLLFTYFPYVYVFINSEIEMQVFVIQKKLLRNYCMIKHPTASVRCTLQTDDLYICISIYFTKNNVNRIVAMLIPCKNNQASSPSIYINSNTIYRH